MVLKCFNIFIVTVWCYKIQLGSEFGLSILSINFYDIKAVKKKNYSGCI